MASNNQGTQYSGGNTNWAPPNNQGFTPNNPNFQGNPPNYGNTWGPNVPPNMTPNMTPNVPPNNSNPNFNNPGYNNNPVSYNYGSPYGAQFSNQNFVPYSPPTYGPQGVPGVYGSWGLYYKAQCTTSELDDLHRWFNTASKDKGVITAQELLPVIFFNHKFSLETCRRLVKIFDKEGNGSIGFDEYSALYKFIQSLDIAFKANDKGQKNKLEKIEAEWALGSIGFKFVSQLHALLFDHFAKKTNYYSI